MNINFKNVSELYSEYDVVERKGIGHPDTLADLIAEEFSNRYSKYCLKEFGEILNHWSDKVVLSGGVSQINFGESTIAKPITAYLFGKAVENVGKHKIPIHDLFKKSCEHIFFNIFHDKSILNYLNYVVDTNSGIGKEHVRSFYLPKSNLDIKNIETYKSNDTIICTGYAPYTVTETLAIDLENYINSNKFKKKFNFTGYDVKVMIVYINRVFDITLCIPFIAKLTESFDFYSISKKYILKNITEYILTLKYLGNSPKFVLNINTKDFKRNAYLVSFGSALDKGDFGAVGRGNKYSGVISLNRKTNIEAVAGKNPQNHSGKIYTIIAHSISWKIYEKFNIPIAIDIAAKNGDPITNPTHVIVNYYSNPINEKTKNYIEKIIRSNISRANGISTKIINNDVIQEHIKNKFIYE